MSSQNAENILWGVAGYVALFVFQLYRPIKNRSGWDFVIQVAFFSANVYLFQRFLKVVLPSRVLAPIQEFWAGVLPDVSLALLIGIVLVAPLTGICFGLLWKYCRPKMSGVLTFIGAEPRDLHFSDTYFRAMYELLGEPIIVSTKQNKVYVGVLIEASGDLNESQRFLRFTPIMSGYREKQDLRVIFNVNYVEDHKQANEPPRRDIILPLSEMSTLSYFDRTLHERFVKTGIAVISKPTNSLQVEVGSPPTKD